jgi:hypothetical protein
VRGLWDADTDQIIFGTHQIAYRGCATAATFFPHQIERELTFFPTRRSPSSRSTSALHVTECFYVPHGPQHDRAVAFVVDVTLLNRARESARAFRSFRGRCSSASASTASPKRKCTRRERRALSFASKRRDRRERWWGGSRARRGRRRCASRCLLRSDARGALFAREPHLDEVTPQLAEYVSRPHLRRDRVPHRRRARRARVAAARRRLPSQGRREPNEAGARSTARRPARAARNAALLRGRAADARLMTPSPVDQPRRRLGEVQHAAHRQGVSARVGLDELAALGHPRLARHLVVRARLRLLFAGVQPRRARGLQPPSRRAGQWSSTCAASAASDVLRPQHQRRHAAAPDRDPAPLQRDARRRMGQRASAADRRSPTTCSRSATRTA